MAELVRHSLMLCDATPPMRDECFVQLVRHTSGNPKVQGLTKAWEMLVVCCATFTPSKSLEPFLSEYLKQRLQTEIKTPFARYAAAALRHLTRLADGRRHHL